MERVDQFQSIKVVLCSLFTVIGKVAFDFRCHTTFHKVRMRIGEVVRKITQKCEEHIYGEILAATKH